MATNRIERYILPRNVLQAQHFCGVEGKEHEKLPVMPCQI